MSGSNWLQSELRFEGEGASRPTSSGKVGGKNGGALNLAVGGAGLKSDSAILEHV